MAFTGQNLTNEELIQKFADLENELKAEKEYSATLRKEIDEYTNSHTLCAKYKELEKENAELREQCSILADCNTCTSACKTENIEMKKQFTKAKEIIKTCLGFMQTFGYSPSMDKFVTEAEQFIKGE